MVAVEIRFMDGAVKVRGFGTGDLNHWTVLHRGEVDRLTGRSFEELERLEEGVWGFQEASATTSRSQVTASRK